MAFTKTIFMRITNKELQIKLAAATEENKKLTEQCAHLLKENGEVIAASNHFITCLQEEGRVNKRLRAKLAELEPLKPILLAIDGLQPMVRLGIQKIANVENWPSEDYGNGCNVAGPAANRIRE